MQLPPPLEDERERARPPTSMREKANLSPVLRSVIEQGDGIITVRRTLLAALMMLLIVGSAEAAITAENYKEKRARYEKIIDHSQDVYRFFENHPKIKYSLAQPVLKRNRRAEKWAINKLNSIERFVYSGRFLPSVWYNIATCESGRNPPNWQHNSGTYQGTFGFHHQSWDGFNTFGYPSEAYLATPEQQYRVALAIHAKYGFTGWGCA